MAVMTAVALSGCASHPSSYQRTDGRPTEPAQMRSALAQCKAEGAVATGNAGNTLGPIPWIVAMATKPSQESTFVDACMARNGYLAP